MIGRQYNLVRRSRGLCRWGAQDQRTGDTIWCFTQWGAIRWIEMNDSRRYRSVP